MHDRLDAKRRLLRKLTKWLRRHFPCQYPVRVYLRDGCALKKSHGQEVYGDCDLIDEERIVIHINYNQNDYELVETILHEWAHAVCYDKQRITEEFHDDTWGKIYSRIYRKFHAGVTL